MNPNQTAQSSRRPHTPYVVVIFGHTGVGISSLVNLIIGHPVSRDHPDAKTTAPKIKPHDPAPIPPSSKQFLFYEVPGFGGRIKDAVILETICQIERGVGIDLFIYCFRNQKATVLPGIGRCIRARVPERIPIIAVVTELERFEAEMDEWWDVVLESDARFTNGTEVERTFFGEDDRFDAHACITTLPRDKVDLLEKLRKRRDQSEDRIRRLILRHCRGLKRGGW